MRAHAVIVAGGTGRRMGSDVPKQLLPLDGVPIIERTLSPFLAVPDISRIVIASAAPIVDDIATAVSPLSTDERPVTVTPGGKTRQESVRKGILSLPADADVIIIHDAVRPFITPEIVGRCIDGAAAHGAVSVMVPVKETVKVVRDGVAVATPDRAGLWTTQTPQAFRRDIITDAHERAERDGFTGTDDCMLVERLGGSIHIIEGSDMNIKITTPTDLVVAEAILDLFEKGGKDA